MQISQNYRLEDGREHYPIGRIRAAAEWRSPDDHGAQADRLMAMRKLVREAKQYGANAVVGLEFHIDDIERADIRGAALLRIAASGIAVKFAEAV